MTFAGGNTCCSYGLYVTIDHGNGLSTLYAHMSKLNVTTGQKVTKGQVLGARRPYRLRDGQPPALRGAQGRQGRQPAVLPAVAAISRQLTEASSSDEAPYFCLVATSCCGS